MEKNGSKGVSNFADTLADMKYLSDQNRIEGKPNFVMGHSMGGGLALLFSSHHPEGINGVIASGILSLVRVFAHT